MNFRYKIPRTREVPSPTLEMPTAPVETFVGSIQGKKASKLEERLARALSAAGIGFEFRVRLSPLLANGTRVIQQTFSNAIGEIEIDFLIQHNGTLLPVQVDGFIGHYRMPWQAEEDTMKDAAVNDAFYAFGARPVVRIPYTKLWTQDIATTTVKELQIL